MAEDVLQSLAGGGRASRFGADPVLPRRAWGRTSGNLLMAPRAALRGELFRPDRPRGVRGVAARPQRVGTDAGLAGRSAGVRWMALVLAGLCVAAASANVLPSSDAERALFISLGAQGLPASPRWYSVDEARARAAAEEADLKKLRQEGFPNPRAEARLRELLALIEKRRSTPGSLSPVVAKTAAPARRPTVVFVSKYMGARGTQFHRQTCDKLYGIVSAIDLPTAVKKFEACPSCAAGLGVKVAAEAEDLRAPTGAAEERERAALAAAQAATAAAAARESNQGQDAELAKKDEVPAKTLSPEDEKKVLGAATDIATAVLDAKDNMGASRNIRVKLDQVEVESGGATSTQLQVEITYIASENLTRGLTKDGIVLALMKLIPALFGDARLKAVDRAWFRPHLPGTDKFGRKRSRG